MIPVWTDTVLWIESCPPKFHTLKSYPTVLQNVILFKNRVIEDVTG